MLNTIYLVHVIHVIICKYALECMSDVELRYIKHQCCLSSVLPPFYNITFFNLLQIKVVNLNEFCSIKIFLRTNSRGKN